MAEQAAARRFDFATLEPHLHWALRIALAAIFLFHGIDKLRNGTPPAGPLDAMFFGSAALFWLVALGETAAGAAMVIGGFESARSELITRIAGGIILVIMAGAAQFHLSGAGGMGTHPWHFMQGGAEFQVLTAMVGLVALVRGRF